MAEVVAKIVLGKLANIIEKKIELLGGVGNNVKQVQRELTRIKCFLKDADSKLKGDERAQNWLNELRNVAYRIEDATDTFFLEVEVHRQKDPSFLQKLKKLCHKPVEVPILHKLGKELEDIQKVLEEIFKSRVHYGITDLQDKSKGEEDKMSSRRATYPEIDETEVVGLQTDVNNIMKMLLPEEVPRRAVITIVGTGGLGKTTLAHMVYKSAKEDFDCHMMLSISQQFSLTNLLRKMLRMFKGSVTENQDVEDLINELRICLGSKRYLIVLDDVWSVNLWKQMINALPDKKNGSRVLITSRHIDVALSADPKMKPYKLNFLNDEESLDLLLKKALLDKLDEEYTDLLDIADELSKKCKGLPLALLVVGGILSTKEQSIHAWKTVLQTLDWHTKGKDCMQVLAMSYEDMPYYLKACFLYLACFPEDYEISVKRLIRMWVAEGFIPCEGRITMEQVAEDCIQELFQRSMVMVTSRRTNGLIKCFNVHDLLRDLAIHEAGKLNFCTIFSQASNHMECSSGIRRASFQFRNPLLMENVNQNTRSLLLFEISFDKVFNFRLLKVLELTGVTYNHDGTSVGTKIFEKLIHLKYLGIRNRTLGHFHYSLDHLKSLETLDVRGDRDPERFPEKVFDGIWAISTLRHVLWDCDINGPTSTANLKNLQTLRWIKAPETWDTELPRLDNLCKLGLRKYYHDSATWVWVTNLFKTLPSLVSLAIEAHRIPLEIVYPKALPKYQNLQSLYLNGEWSLTGNLEASLFPPHLIKLTLIDSKLKENPMSELGKLRNLKKLCLKRNVFNYTSPTICSIGFPVLQYLEMGDWLIKDLTVAKGVMQKLRYLQATPNLKLHLPPELEHVTINFLNYYF